MGVRFDRGQTTRQHIVAVATRLFTDDGYEAVSIDTVLKACALSRGALYHHFASKEALFAVVLDAVEARIADRLRAAGEDAVDPLQALRAGAGAWFDLAAQDAAVRRIVLTDAPAVVGWQAWRAMDEAYSLGLLRSALAAAAAQGRVRSDRVDVYAHALLALLVELALLIARSPGDAAVAEGARAVVETMLRGLFDPQPL